MSTKTTATAAELAKWLCLSERRISQLATEGIVVRKGRGRYLLRESVKAYIGALRDRHEAGPLKERELRLKCEKLEQDIDRRRDEIAAEVQTNLQQGIIEGLQIIRKAYQDLNLPRPIFNRLARAFDRAIRHIAEVLEKKHQQEN